MTHSCHHRVVNGDPVRLSFSTFSLPASAPPPAVCSVQVFPVYSSKSETQTAPAHFYLGNTFSLDPSAKPWAAFASRPLTQIPSSDLIGHGCQGQCHNHPTRNSG